MAQYADARNVFGGPERIAHKYEVLRGHCEAVGRDYDEIERTTHQTSDHARRRRGPATPARLVDRFGELADAGAQHIIFSVRGVGDTAQAGAHRARRHPQLRAL